MKVWAGLVASMLLLSACGGGASGSRTAATPASPTGGASSALIDVTTNQPLQVAANKPTLLYFMALGCASCIVGERQLIPVQQALGKQVAFVSVDVDPTQGAANLADFARQYGGSWAHVLDTQGLVGRYRITTLDTVVVLARGKEVYRSVGVPSAEALTKQLRTIVAGGG